jgi:hypothetical protein
MDSQLCFAPHYVARYLDEIGLFLISERDSVVFEGPIYGALYPYLISGEQLDVIVDGIEDKFPEPEILYAINTLEDGGYLVHSSERGTIPTQTAAYWTARKTIPELAVRALGEAAVTVVVDGEFDKIPIQRAMSAAGLRDGRGSRSLPRAIICPMASWNSTRPR